MICHYNQSLNEHLRAGRNTVEEILSCSESQSFDVSIGVTVGWRRVYTKRFSAFITNPKMPKLVVLDALSHNENSVFISPDTDSRKVFEQANTLALQHYDTFLMNVLSKNDFDEFDD